ncbi:MAG: Lrp/AsnC family transcriptional regulator [Planctomycetota bacterium]|jgi:DNA-binding Lrp family transcriptional regulator
MDDLDRRILQTLQNDFLLENRPYETMARNLGIPHDELWRRTEQLMADGVIRRMGASLDSAKLGFSSTLAAVSVAPGLVEQAAQTIGAFPDVTHSCLRRDLFNIWFTIIAVDTDRIAHIFEQIRSALSLEGSQILNLPVKRLFKLDAHFDIFGKTPETHCDSPPL